jgi:hypothetical protein
MLIYDALKSYNSVASVTSRSKLSVFVTVRLSSVEAFVAFPYRDVLEVDRR